MAITKQQDDYTQITLDVNTNGVSARILLNGKDVHKVHDMYLRIWRALQDNPLDNPPDSFGSITEYDAPRDPAPPKEAIPQPGYTGDPIPQPGYTGDPIPQPLNGDPIPVAGFTATGTVPPAPAPATSEQPDTPLNFGMGSTSLATGQIPQQADVKPAEPKKEPVQIDLGGTRPKTRKPRKVNSTQLKDFVKYAETTYAIMLDEPGTWAVVQRRWADIMPDSAGTPESVEQVLAKEWDRFKATLPAVLDDIRRSVQSEAPAEAVTASTGGAVDSASSEIQNFMTPAPAAAVADTAAATPKVADALNPVDEDDEFPVS